MLFSAYMLGFGGGGSYIPQGIATNDDYLTRGADLTGSSDSKVGTVSAWVKTNGSVSGMRIVFGIGDAFEMLVRGSTEVFAVRAENSSGTKILDIEGTTDLSDNAWHHVAASWDLSDNGKQNLLIDGVDELVEDTWTDDTIDYTLTDWSVAAQIDGSLDWVGDLADVWFDQSYIELATAANLQKFRSATGRPVFLGRDGSVPLGTAPIIYCSGAVDFWETNKGTGGGFTENGTLTRASSNPP